MSTKDLKAIAGRLYEEYNKGETAALAVIDELYAADIIQHSNTGQDTRGIKDYKQHVSELSSSFPDLHFTIDDIFAEGDRVALRVTAIGTFKGAFAGIPPTNKKVKYWGIGIDRIVGGKIVEEWIMLDILGLMQQLGAAMSTPKK
jgi:steroid delta-isomerase-like uncharacterized protein